MNTDKILDTFLGLSVGDAFGVPYEFMDREEVGKILKDEMVGFGTWNQSPGTWSDDSSLSFCLAESLINGYNLKDIASKMLDWHQKGLWTATGRIFDIGLTTMRGISIIEDIFESKDFKSLYYLKYEALEESNGNGGLMRILPLLFVIKGENINNQFKKIWEVSALTHGHIRSAISCLIYIKFAEYLLKGEDKFLAYKKMQKDIKEFFVKNNIERREINIFTRIIDNNINEFPIIEIKSSGYVIDTLESILHIFLNTNSYKTSIIESVKLGGDTDTIASMVGGISGLYYGKGEIPKNWINVLKKKDEIEKLAIKFSLSQKINK